MHSHDLTRRLFLGSLGATLGVARVARARRRRRQPRRRTPPTSKRTSCTARAATPTCTSISTSRPVHANKRMAMIHFHGGGFAGGSKDGLAARLQTMSARGYVEHRRAVPAFATASRSGPSQIEDVKASIRWTRANASRLGIDPARVAVAGYSAGGHLALFAAGTQNRPEFEGKGGNAGVPTNVAACLAYYAVTGPAWEGFRRQFPMPEGSSEEAWSAGDTGHLHQELSADGAVPRARGRHGAAREQHWTF